MKWLSGLLLLIAAASPSMLLADSDVVTVGSKKFTESVVLGELAVQLLQAGGIEATHRREIGGTRVLWEALKRGDIQVYPEYTGTLRRELLGLAGENPEKLQQELADLGLKMSPSLGFANNYALAMQASRAADLGVETISDLAATSSAGFRFGFSHEFLNREDGWPGLQQTYSLPQKQLRGLDHDLAYRALDEGAVDVIEVYTTDAEIAYYELKVLEDDRNYFTRYSAVWLYRDDLPTEAMAALNKLTGRVSEGDMRRMNSAVKLEGAPEAVAAAEFLVAQGGFGVETNTAQHAVAESAWSRFFRTTRQHLLLVGLSLAGALLVALPLGIVAASSPTLRQPLLAAVAVLQTIPSLALLVIMVPLLGIGAGPAIFALFLYSLLPIVRNTVTALTGIPRSLRDSARAIGLPAGARLRQVYLPLAMPQILAGVKIAAVINVGTATLAALVGAGGYGEPILTGIRLDNTGLILWGALPAAGMALLVQAAFDLIERLIVSPGLRR